MDHKNEYLKVKLKPCPFCGGEATMYWNEHCQKYYTECDTDNGNCCCTDWGGTTQEEDAEGWNTRLSDEKYGHPTISPYYFEDFTPEKKEEALEAKVLPCPWCGKYPAISALLSDQFDPGYSIDCENSSCSIRPEGTGRTIVEAVADWNRRPKGQRGQDARYIS